MPKAKIRNLKAKKLKQKPKSNKNKSRDQSWKADFGRFMSAGVQITATVVAGVLIGRGIDMLLEYEKPVFTLVFGIIACITAIYQFIKLMNR